MSGPGKTQARDEREITDPAEAEAPIRAHVHELLQDVVRDAVGAGSPLRVRILTGRDADYYSDK